MLQYLVVLLDDTSVSYCHCDNPFSERRLISVDDLKAGIRFAMLENLMIQFVYPDYELPSEYCSIIESIDHHDIRPSRCNMAADAVVFNGWEGVEDYAIGKKSSCVICTSKKEFFAQYVKMIPILYKANHLNIVIKDVDSFSEEDFDTYKIVLDALAKEVKTAYQNGKSPQVNLLTDRMMLNQMNNCNAGCDSVTLAPNGKFYICPAFYYADELDCVGDLNTGLNIKNAQLFKLECAPLCRHCDAYQCKRCVFLNRKTTSEVNTPSHEQCVVSHLERNTSCKLLRDIRKSGEFMPDIEIDEINYLDPYDVRKEW